MVYGPYAAFISVFEPYDPMLLFCTVYHLSVLIPKFAMFFMYRVVKVVEFNLAVYLSSEFAHLVPFV